MSRAQTAWAEMLASDAKTAEQHKENNAKSSVQQQFADDELLRLLMRPDKKKKKKKKKTITIKSSASASKLDNPSTEAKLREKDVSEAVTDERCEQDQESHLSPTPAALPSTAVLTDPAMVLRMLQRDMNLLSDSAEARSRINAAERLLKVLFPEHGEDLEEAILSEVFAELQKPLLRRLSDSAEKCRELSIILLTMFLSRCEDLGPVLPYMFPAVMDRNSDTFVFDVQNNEMVRDLDAHEAKQRGKAIPLADGGTTFKHSVREPSEEVRLLLCQMLGTLMNSFTSRGLHSMLGPYFHDLVMFFHACAVDPYPTLRCEGLKMLQTLAQEPSFENTMHHYCTALVRSVMPSLRHRRSAVKIAAIRCIGALVACPYRNKCKGGGTDAIVDLVGFREDNVIPVVAFYHGETRLNYLGCLVTDENSNVRVELYKMLGMWLTTLLDRWDHAARLLPFLLSALSDQCEQAQNAALGTLDELGKQYEEEHHEEILEKRQYGVDGAQGRANYAKPLPAPWKGRPRMGTRLYVRQHCRRFLHTVLRELQDWKSTTRSHAAGLLRTMLVYMEEHVTMELHSLIETYFRFSENEEIGGRISECAEITGRYVDPSAYLPLVLPHVQGKEGTHGIVAGTRWESAGRAITILDHLLDGTILSRVVPHFSELVSVLTDRTLVQAASQRPSLCTHMAKVLRHPAMLLDSSDGRKAADAHFLATGRLSSLRTEAVDLLQSVVNLLRVEGGDKKLYDDLQELLVSLVQATEQFGRPGELLAARVYIEPDSVSRVDQNAWENLRSLQRWLPSDETGEVIERLAQDYSEELLLEDQ